MATPSWLAASVGSRADAGLVTQFLGTHAATWLYPGTQRGAESTGSGLYQGTNRALYLAQSFTTSSSQTTIGVVALQISTVGGSPTTAAIGPLSVSLYASSAGLPTGGPLATTAVAEQVVYSSPFWLPVPLPASVTASTVYQIVVAPAGTASSYYVWQQSDQTSGASTSGDAAAWAAQGHGMMYQVYDQGASGLPQYLVEDSGARVTQLSYSGSVVSSLTESTIAQDGTVLTSTRTLTYSNGLLTGVN